MGDRESHLRHGLRRLGEETEVRGVSGVYETDPVGFADQPRFLNMVVRVATALEPEALLDLGRRVERERDRERPFRGAPRTLDIDVLLYGDRRIQREDLTVPHPRMRDRLFVLVPLVELAPDLRDPETGRLFRRYLEDFEAAPVPGARRIMDGEELRDGAV